MDITTKIIDDLMGVFLHQTQDVEPVGYNYRQIAILRRPEETTDDLQTRCVQTVAPWIPQTKEGRRDFALFTAIGATDV